MFAELIMMIMIININIRVKSEESFNIIMLIMLT